MILKDILSQIYIDVKDLAQKEFPRAYLVSLINNAQTDICTRCKMMQTYTSTTTVVGTREYALPDNWLDIDYRGGVRFGNNKLEQQTIQLWDNYNSGWEAATANGTPNTYYIRKNFIGLDPKPSTAATLEMYYIKKATDLTADADIPFEGLRQFDIGHIGLVYYPLWRIAITNDKQNKAAAYLQLYEKAVQDIMTVFNDKTDLDIGFRPMVDATLNNI